MKAIAAAARAAFCGVLAAGVTLPTACSSNEQPTDARSFGTVTMPLSTTVGANTYRLDAVFVITGAQGDITLSTNADEPSLSTTLPTGSYSAFIQSFTLSKDDGTGTLNPVTATVESDTEPFTVFANSTTTVHFQFDTSGAQGGGCTGSTPKSGSGSVTASALIDGRSILSISPTGFSWQHLDFAGPGMLGFQTLPTTLDVTLDGQTTAYAWCPTWANGCNTCDDSCGELREPMTSAPFAVTVSPGSMTVTSFTCSGRGVCELMQAPDASNGYVALIDMNDDAEGAAAVYTATASYTYSCR